MAKEFLGKTSIYGDPRFPSLVLKAVDHSRDSTKHAHNLRHSDSLRLKRLESHVAHRARERMSRSFQAFRADRQNKNDTSRIIKVDGELNEAQAEEADIKIEVSLRIAGDRSHMMKSGNFFRHRCHIVSKRIQSAKAFGGRGYFFCPAVPMRIQATMALTAASVAPIAMISLKACTKDSAIARPINCLVV